MKVCETCGREYLDMYQTCPFCAKAELERVGNAAVPPVRRPEPKVARWPLIIGLVVAGIALAAIVVWGMRSATAPALADDDAPAQELTDAAEQRQCLLNQTMIESAATICYADVNAQIHEVEQLYPDYLETVPRCAGGGAYSILWVGEAPRVSCSLHPRD